MAVVKPMEIDDYIAEVYIAACDEMNDIIEEEFDNVTFSECYRHIKENMAFSHCLLDHDDVSILVSKLIWDYGFREDFRKVMGYPIDTDNPHAFDTCVRLYCLEIMEPDLRGEFMASSDCIFSVVEG